MFLVTVVDIRNAIAHSVNGYRLNDRTLLYHGRQMFLTFHIPDIGSEAHSDFHPTNTKIFYSCYSVGESIVTEDYLLPSLRCIELNSSVFFVASLPTQSSLLFSDKFT